jgi:hypothetical protein
MKSWGLFRNDRVAISLGLAVLAAVLLAACGSGSGSSGSSGSGSSGSSGSTSSASGDGAISRAEMITQGNAICRRATVQISAELAAQAKQLAAAGKKLDDASEEHLLATVTAPTVVRMAEELAALGDPPGGEKGEMEALIGGLEAAARKLEREPAAGLSQDPLAGPAGKAGALGLTACAQV